MDSVTTKFGIGQPTPRKEDPRLVRGLGQYTDDIRHDNMLYGAVVRTPHAHAGIRSLDISSASDADGVRLVMTAADLEAAGIGTLPVRAIQKNSNGTDMPRIPRPVLAGEKVAHVGEPVAFVVADTPTLARDAAEMVNVDYDVLDPVVATRDAIREDTPNLWPQAPDNLVLDWDVGDADAVREALREAAHVVELEVENNRVVVAPMEPRSAIGMFDVRANRYVLHASSQGAHKLAAPLADHVLRIPRGDLRVLTDDVGGAFGMKNFLFHEYVLVLVAARMTGRAVKWTADRSESFVSDLQGRDRIMRGRMAFDSGYRITGLEVDVVANFGAYVSQLMPFVATVAAVGIQSMLYAIPALHTRVHGVVTNTIPIDAYRGAGRPETAFLVERLIDVASRRFDISPAELRRRNYVREDQFPWETGAGLVYDCGAFDRHLDLALKQADAAGFPARRIESEARGRLRGFGLTGVFDRCGGLGPDMADLIIDQSGSATLKVGTQTNGQGHETVYTQIIADRLGIEPSKIRVQQGDSDLVPYGSGNGGSNFAAVAGNACNITATRAIAKGRRIAAHVLDADESDVEFQDGVYRVVDTNRSITLADIARRSYDPGSLPTGEEPGFQVRGSFKPLNGPTFPNGTHICELEVDPETGEIALLRYITVDDVGIVLNPLIVDGQMHGGVAQGIGQALTENTVYDEVSGQLLSGTFMDYQIPRARDLPMIETTRIAVPTKRNPLGVKGVGETGAIGAPPAVMNALVDALAHLGIEHIDMPATPVRIWRAIRDARVAH